MNSTLRFGFYKESCALVSDTAARKCGIEINKRVIKKSGLEPDFFIFAKILFAGQRTFHQSNMTGEAAEEGVITAFGNFVQGEVDRSAFATAN